MLQVYVDSVFLVYESVKWFGNVCQGFFVVVKGKGEKYGSVERFEFCLDYADL